MRLPNNFVAKVDLGWAAAYESLYYFRTPYEEPLTRLIRESLDTDGGSFVDIGANVGIFCFSVADILVQRGGRALAIEPIAENYSFLEESIAANDLETVVMPLLCAAGDREGILELSKQSYGHISNAIPLGWGAGGNSEAEILRWSDPAQGSHGVVKSASRLATLDSLVRENELEDIAMIKIDVEGGGALRPPGGA